MSWWPWRQNPWFETVLEAQRRAKKRLPPSVYAALVAGSERGTTPRDNTDAFAELEFAPHVAGHQPERDLSTTVLGIPISLPVLISPTGVQAVDPEGEVAVARAAAARARAPRLLVIALATAKVGDGGDELLPGSFRIALGRRGFSTKALDGFHRSVDL